ncbi:MAG: hypothetical protein JSS72_09465 [Armatimonadetes bacterium]|nr:hypothetical protein [Armatimonadota bacterium]
MPRKKQDLTPDVPAAPIEDAAEEPKPAKPVRRRKSVLSSFVEKVAEAVGLSEPEPAPAEPPKRRRSTKAEVSAPTLPMEDAPAVAAASTKATADFSDFADHDFPMPVWRAVTRSAKRSEPEVQRRSRRGGGGRRGEEQRKPVTAAEALQPEEPKRGRTRGRVAPKAEPKPVEIPKPEPVPPFIPTKPAIPIPADAPQVVRRDGIPILVRDGNVLPPLFFFGGASSEKQIKTVLEEVKMAAMSGIHLHAHLLEFEVDIAVSHENAQAAAYLLKRTVEIDPEAQVIFRIVFKAPRGWQHNYPKAKYYTHDGAPAEPSLADDQFWGEASRLLQSFVKKMRAHELNKHILGLHLERGEWFMAKDWGYDNSEAAKIKFRDWCRTRYVGDIVTLRAAWFDGDANFDTIQVVEYQPEGAEGDRFVRSSRRQRRYVDYHLYLSDMTMARIEDLAHAVKEASEGYFLVGASYGYTFEWSHPSNGHLALGKLLRARDIDFIAGPPSYVSREPGGSAPFPGPIDSFSLNGKLFISEEDFKTAIATREEPDDFNPTIKTPQALESVHWRGAGAALAHGAGACWMDLWGNGWLKTANIWQRAAIIKKALITRLATPLADPDVAVLIDERSLAYLVDPQAFHLLVQNVRESVLRAGVSAGFYLMSDLVHRDRFPEAKLYVFLNAWDIRSDLRAAIKQKLQRDDKVLFWLYAGGLFEAGREALERAREATGIALKLQPYHSKSGSTIINRRHPLCEAMADRPMVSETQLEPSYFAIPEGAVVLGEYSQTGLPSFVVKEFDGPKPEDRWKSVFLGEPIVTPALIRSLAQMAGAHVYNYQEDVVHAGAPFLTVHCKKAGARAIALPNKFSAYNLVSGQWQPLDGTSLKFTAIEGSTHSFLVGIKEEIEQLLELDPETLLKMAVLPPREEESHREDIANFDVPIMRLGEYMEDSSDEESPDDWFLNPKMIDLPPLPPQVEQTETSRRRRPRRRGDRGGSEESTYARKDAEAPVFEDEDLSMSVVFRKRD